MEAVPKHFESHFRTVTLMVMIQRQWLILRPQDIRLLHEQPHFTVPCQVALMVNQPAEQGLWLVLSVTLTWASNNESKREQFLAVLCGLGVRNYLLLCLFLDSLVWENYAMDPMPIGENYWRLESQSTIAGQTLYKFRGKVLRLLGQLLTCCFLPFHGFCYCPHCRSRILVLHAFAWN